MPNQQNEQGAGTAPARRPIRPQATGFYITSKKGFHITFENGWTVSVQFGPSNYSENYDLQIGQDEAEAGKRGSSTAETAVWPPNGSMLDRGDGDTVQGYQTPAQVLELLTWAAAQVST